MLNKRQVSEITEHLEKAKNPVFLYDNDADGLVSYVLLRRFIGRGKGVALRTYPEIDVGYAKKVQELGADYVFVLDKPFLGKEFLAELESLKIPLVWIDHHLIDRSSYEYSNLHVYNSADKGGEAEPVTALCYQVTDRVEDLWIAMMGCIADHYWPAFTKQFAEAYPEFWTKDRTKDPFDIYYSTGIGTLARSLGFGLKDSLSHVVYLQNTLIACKSPSEFMRELESESSFGIKYRDIREKVDSLLVEAKKLYGEKFIFFKYGGTMSMSADLANEISYRNSKSVVAVVYQSGAINNISLRGKNIRKVVEKLLPTFIGASGGGHRDAVGVRIRSEDLEKFEAALKKAMKLD